MTIPLGGRGGVRGRRMLVSTHASGYSDHWPLPRSTTAWVGAVRGGVFHQPSWRCPATLAATRVREGGRDKEYATSWCFHVGCPGRRSVKEAYPVSSPFFSSRPARENSCRTLLLLLRKALGWREASPRLVVAAVPPPIVRWERKQPPGLR